MVVSMRLASDDPEAERRALAAGELWRSAQRFLDERARALAALAASPPDVMMLLRRTWMALLTNGHLTAAQYEILMRDADGLDAEGDAEVAVGGGDGGAVGVVRPLMRVEIPHVMREDI